MAPARCALSGPRPAFTEGATTSAGGFVAVAAGCSTVSPGDATVAATTGGAAVMGGPIERIDFVGRLAPPHTEVASGRDEH